jgi:flagellar hook-basal body complex protein FliE
VINPLDALSSLTQAQLPGMDGAAAATGAAGAAPAAPGNAISEGFNNMLQSVQSAPISEAANPLASIGSVGSLGSVGSAGGGSPATWGHMVQQMVLDVNNKQQTASALVNDVLKGGPTPIHQAMVATEEASLSFEFLAEMRNKVVDAYQQVMQMQV